MASTNLPHGLSRVYLGQLQDSVQVQDQPQTPLTVSIRAGHRGASVSLRHLPGLPIYSPLSITNQLALTLAERGSRFLVTLLDPGYADWPLGSQETPICCIVLDDIG